LPIRRVGVGTLGEQRHYAFHVVFERGVVQRRMARAVLSGPT
jgi:hypothetical protein